MLPINMDRRQFLRIGGMVSVTGLAGCGSQSGRSTDAPTDTLTDSPTDTASPTETATPTDTATPEFLDELVTAINRETEDWGGPVETDDLSERFVETLRVNSGDGYSKNGLAFLDRLETVSESLEMKLAVTTATSVVGFDSISKDDLATIDRWLDAPMQFQRAAFIALPYKPTEAIAGALADSSGDGIRDGFLIGSTGAGPVLERLHEPRPVVAEMRSNLATEGYTERELAYMSTAVRYSSHKGSPYEVWAQAERHELLVEATTDGEISETEPRKIRNSSNDRLINAQAEAFGFDPTRSDTAGDGFPDHLSWLLAEAFDYPLHPTEPNVYVEVVAAEGVDHLSANEREELVDLFANAPGEPIHLHLYEGASDVTPLPNGTRGALLGRASEAERRQFGHHFVLLNDRQFGDRSGFNTRAASWIDGSLPWTERTSIVAHELGHSFGISGGAFGGVDSEQYSPEEYASVMNYAADDDFVGFNDDDPFDDWERMREQQFGRRYLDRSGLRQAWQNGSV